MAVGDIVHLSIQGQYLSERLFIGHHFRQLQATAVPDQPEQDLIDDWQANLRTTYLAAVSDDAVLTQLLARQVAGATPLRSPTVEPDTSAATMTSTAPLASFLAIVIAWRSNRAGRRYQGRTYMGGGDEIYVAGNSVLTGGTNWHAKVDAYRAAMIARYGVGGASATWRLVVWSRTTAGDPPAPDQNPPNWSNAHADVVAGITRTALHSQRRRKPRAI